MIRYVVECQCPGGSGPLAFLCDERADGAGLSITKAGDATAKIVIDAPPMVIATYGGGQTPSFPEIKRRSGDLERGWADYDVVETVWRGGNQTYVIRCRTCSLTVQMSSATLAKVADGFAAARDELQVSPQGLTLPLKLLNAAVLRFDS